MTSNRSQLHNCRCVYRVWCHSSGGIYGAAIIINGPRKMSLIRPKVAVFLVKQSRESTRWPMRRQAGGRGWSWTHPVQSASIHWTSVPFIFKTKILRSIPSKVRLAALNLNLIRNSFKWLLTCSVNRLLWTRPKNYTGENLEALNTKAQLLQVIPAIVRQASRMDQRQCLKRDGI